MQKFNEIINEDGRVIAIETCHKGRFLLQIPEINKDSAFTNEERDTFDIEGKLPIEVETLEQQVTRYYEQYKELNTNIEKNNFLNRLKNHNEVAFYRLAMNHLKEILPIIYTPTIGDAVEQFSFQFDIPQGLYFSYPKRGTLSAMMDTIPLPNVELIIITDGEGVLGIGDWGAGGIDICVGKLMVYTLCAGINPRRVLPIQIDVGTNNQKLLDDPMYLGWRNPRLSGKEYDDFIDEAVDAITSHYPNIFLHWEDFGRGNARRNLDRYRNKICTFNDDMQGTGATATASVLSALKAIDQDITDQRIVFFGAGTAGTGIADQICNAMLNAGMTPEDTHKHFWLIDRPGLLLDDTDGLTNFQAPYARQRDEVKDWKLDNPKNISLLDVVNHVNPTVLIGCSTMAGAFTEEIVKKMAEENEHPIIFPLSNPTELSEAKPEDLIQWSKGKAIVATGSPFDPVIYNGKKIPISQCNNAYIFPGLGLGIIACKASRVTDGMISAASHALSDKSPAIKNKDAPILPDFDVLHEVSRYIALQVALQAQKEGVAQIAGDIDLSKHIEAIFWEPNYLPLRYTASLLNYE